MIDERSFEEVTRQTVGAVLDAYGYALSAAADFRIRFEKPSSYVEVTYDASRSHEASIWLGELPANTEPPLELADVLRATDCGSDDIRFAELIQTSDVAALRQLLERASLLLRKCASDFLEDGPQALDRARALRSERAAAYTAEIRNRPVLEAADAAWAEKEYGRVHDLLYPIRDTLGESHRRRLAFAERKV
jgi:hypothetical protein